MKTPILRKSVLVAFFLSFPVAAWALNVPKPMAIDIDDLGWKEGWDLHESGGPYRLGLPPGRSDDACRTTRCSSTSAGGGRAAQEPVHHERV